LYTTILACFRYDFQPRAYGVKFRHGKKNLIAKCHREVILSAGAISSPQILMLSGIGPADHLHYHGIPVKVDLPVGKSLQSHVGTGEIVFTMKAKESYDPRRYFSNPGKYILPYFTRRGEGPLGSPAGFEALSNFRTGLDNSTRCVASSPLFTLSSFMYFLWTILIKSVLTIELAWPN
jgi:choline dehydrogenase-like flavoprotein